MTTKNSNWNKVRDFIKTTTLEGLETMMVAIQNRGVGFTDDQSAQIAALVTKDAVQTAAARLSAAPTGRVVGWETEIQPIVESASFADVKKYVHALDTRIKSLPQNQKDILFAEMDTAALNKLLAGLTLPPTGEYLGDDDQDNYAADPCGDLPDTGDGFVG